MAQRRIVSLDRRRLLQRSAAVGMLGLGGCATSPGAGPSLSHAASVPVWDVPPPLRPVRAEAQRLFDITVCLRPFRAAGPRLDAERIGDTTVVHNYGHGGSGWSLSWGGAASRCQGDGLQPAGDRGDRLRRDRPDLGDHRPAGGRQGHHLRQASCCPRPARSRATGLLDAGLAASP